MTDVDTKAVYLQRTEKLHVNLMMAACLAMKSMNTWRHVEC